LVKTILIALGGNAIKKADETGTAGQQFRNVRETCKHILEIIKRGYKVVITHGNGPQAGNLLIQQEEASKIVPPQPLDVIGAMTQGQVGYMLQQTLKNYLKKAGLNIPVATVLTQVLVDKNDPEFKDPSKPVGPFYTKEEAERLAKKKGYIIKKVRPVGEKAYRRVVPSPEPIAIIEQDVIKRLVDAGVIVIASGGGGVPVILKEDGSLEGIEAVIDKDLAGEKLAEVVDADIFLILTDVENVKLNYGKPNEWDIDRMTLAEAQKYLKEGQFLPGSMKPKISACIRFLESGGGKAIITSLDKAVEALEGKTGTLITK
jgi:carbamate kinase